MNAPLTLLAAVRPMVAMTLTEAREKEHHGMRFMFCRCDVLNPCWDNRPTDIPGQHWGGGDACPECVLRAAIAEAEKPAPGAGSWTPPEVFLIERDQYGAKVFHPDCAITRSVCEVLGTKTMPWRGIDHLKRIGHTVTVRGTGGRTL